MKRKIGWVVIPFMFFVTSVMVTAKIADLNFVDWKLVALGVQRSLATPISEAQ